MDATVLILIVAVIAALVLIGVGLFLGRRPKRSDPLEDRLAEYRDNDLPALLEEAELGQAYRDSFVGAMRQRFNDLFSAPVKPQKQIEDVLNQPLSNASPGRGSTPTPDQKPPPTTETFAPGSLDDWMKEQEEQTRPPSPPAVAPPIQAPPALPPPASLPPQAPPAPPPRPSTTTGVLPKPITPPSLEREEDWTSAFDEDEVAPEPEPAEAEGGEDPFGWVDVPPAKPAVEETPAISPADIPDWLQENVTEQAEANTDSPDWLRDGPTSEDTPEWLTETLAEEKTVDELPAPDELPADWMSDRGGASEEAEAPPDGYLHSESIISTRPDWLIKALEEAKAASAGQPAQFAAYYPKEVTPESWHPLHAYIYKAFAASLIEADAAQQLGPKQTGFRGVRGVLASLPVEEGAVITATPSLPGFQFNPPSVSLGFYKDWHRFDFELRAKGAALHQSANGAITFTVEGVIVADVPLSIYVGDSAPETGPLPIRSTAKAYTAIFCSYSHQDSQIVARAERAYKALGMDYLRDVVSLKSGQDWSVELLNLIERADVFQLFWSRAASESQHVRFEWEHALKLLEKRPGFIRPVYWQDDPQPTIPPELNQIHFAYQPDLET